MTTLPDAQGHFGRFGGRFVPETLMAPLHELERAYRAAGRDPKWERRLAGLLADVGWGRGPCDTARPGVERCAAPRVELTCEGCSPAGARMFNSVLAKA